MFSDAGAAVRDIDCDEAVASNPPGGGNGTGGGSSGGSSGGNPPSGRPDPDRRRRQLGRDERSVRPRAAAARAGPQDARHPARRRQQRSSTAALSACKLKNQSKAKQYYAKASSGAKTGIRQTCLRDAKFDPGVEEEANLGPGA